MTACRRMHISFLTASFVPFLHARRIRMSLKKNKKEAAGVSNVDVSALAYTILGMELCARLKTAWL